MAQAPNPTGNVVAVNSKQNVAIASYDDKDVIEVLAGLNLVDVKWADDPIFKAFVKQEIIEIVNVHRVTPIHYKNK